MGEIPLKHRPLEDPRVRKKRTICEAHRDIYRELQKENPDLQVVENLLREAFDYGVRMAMKLGEYAGKEWKQEVFLDESPYSL